MNRSTFVVVLVAAAVLLCCVLNFSPVTKAALAAPALDDATAMQAETVKQLKEIHGQLEHLNALLCSGKVKVVVVLNPDAQ